MYKNGTPNIKLDVPFFFIALSHVMSNEVRHL